MKSCLFCGKNLSKRSQSKYCSNKCQADQGYKEYINKWENGKVDGGKGINTRNISGYLRRFLVDKYKESCSVCGWNKKHSVTNIVPLEIDHIDGNGENNKEVNLRLLCPNCHALTSNFRNLNKGKGRLWRKDKYKINK